MNYITTTELRTKSKELIKVLQQGRSVDLIHRSRIVGKILPSYEPQPLTPDGIEKIMKAAQKLNLPKLSYKEREKRYRAHLKKKYDKGLS